MTTEVSREAREAAFTDDDAFREMHLLYNYADDDSRQFTRWQMSVAMYHGIKLGEARQSAERGEAWRPIETAPLDGTPVLLFARSVRAIAPVRVVGWYIKGRGWLECAFSPNEPVGLVPSAWRTLPDMPARFDDTLPTPPEAV